MSTGYYLLDHPNPNGDHFYTVRRKRLVAQVIHITAGLEDIDLIGPDKSCESVTKYAATTARDVSWHSGSDTDGYIRLLPYSYTAWQCVNYNSSTAGHEISKLETDWRDDDPEVVKRRLYWTAEAIRPQMISNQIPFRKATKAEVDRAIATNGPPVGLIGHRELDPDRRTDPGYTSGVDTFPWERLIRFLKKQETLEDQDMTTEQFNQIMDVLKGIKASIDGTYNSGFASRGPDGKDDPTHEEVSIRGVNNQLNKATDLLQQLVDSTKPTSSTP